MQTKRGPAADKSVEWDEEKHKLLRVAVIVRYEPIDYDNYKFVVQNEARHCFTMPANYVKHDTKHNERDKNAFDVEFPHLDELPVDWRVVFSVFERLLPKRYSKERIDDSA